jgi:hypothetical protein
LAIMGWARRSEAARAAVGRVDAVRTDYLVAQFESLGLDRDEAECAHRPMRCRCCAQRTDLPLASRQAMVARLHARLTQESVAGR